MGKGIVVCALAVIFLAGCSMPQWKSKADGPVTLSWYCVNKQQDGAQTCQKRNLRNGKPVDDVVYETMVIPGDKAPPEMPKVEAAPPRPSAGEAVAWDRKPLTAINKVDDTAAEIAVENLGPALRQPKNTVDMWEKHRKQQGKAAPASTPEAQPSGTKAADSAAIQPPPVAPAPAVAAAKPQFQPKAAAPAKSAPAPATRSVGYTVQLAAFATLNQCETFMANKKFAELSLQKQKIYNDGRQWWVVTHGEFATYDQAEKVSQTLAGKYAKIEPWVRSWAVLQALAK